MAIVHDAWKRAAPERAALQGLLQWNLCTTSSLQRLSLQCPFNALVHVAIHFVGFHSVEFSLYLVLCQVLQGAQALPETL